MLRCLVVKARWGFDWEEGGVEMSGGIARWGFDCEEGGVGMPGGAVVLPADMAMLIY